MSDSKAHHENLKKDFIQPKIIGKYFPLKDFSNCRRDVAKKQMNSSEKGFFITKITLVVIVYIFLVCNSLYDFASPDYVPECVRDEMHEFTKPINHFLAENKLYKSLVIIVASAMIDINVFVLAARWILYGRSYKTFYIIIAFYAFRAFLQSVFFLKFPSDYIWGHPGLFSITVPYNPANDFFYSGHLGLCTICYIHFKREGVRFMTHFGLVTIVVEFFTLLVTRAHYFIDLVVGMIIAHYIFLVSDWVHEYIVNRRKQKEAKAEEVQSPSSTQPGSLDLNDDTASEQ